MRSSVLAEVFHWVFREKKKKRNCHNIMLTVLSSMKKTLKHNCICHSIFCSFCKQDFMRCMLISAKPVCFCETCKSQYSQLNQAYRNITKSSGRNSVDCHTLLLLSDRVQAVEKTHAFVDGLWTDSTCGGERTVASLLSISLSLSLPLSVSSLLFLSLSLLTYLAFSLSLSLSLSLKAKGTDSIKIVHVLSSYHI